MKKQISTILLLLVVASALANMRQYKFQRDLLGVSETWHTVVLPDNVFGKMSPTLNDIRIFGITESSDTIEAQYILETTEPETSLNRVDFKILNKSHQSGNFHYTLETPAESVVNQIKLNFNTANFDWRVTLEGSQNRDEWFTILEDYRILSIENASTNYAFTDLSFPDSKYRYYRIVVNSKQDPQLQDVQLTQMASSLAVFKSYNSTYEEVVEEKAKKQTVMRINLGYNKPVSVVGFSVAEDFDFYRPITIQYLADSTKTEQGWIFHYRNVAQTTLSSLEKSEFHFPSTIAQKFQVIIENYDNQPLTIDSVWAKGYVHQLKVRFTVPGSYFLCYGNSAAARPNYEIAHFANQIPEKITQLKVGPEVEITHEQIALESPLFESKIWLWMIMIVIIAVLGWFTIKMLKN